MNDTTILFILVVLVSLIPINFAFLLFKKANIDYFRYQAFVERDKLFDYAKSGGISFNDKAYMMARTQINGYIRFADEINILIIIILFLRGSLKSDQDADFNKEFEKAKESLDEGQRKFIEGRLDKVNRHLAIMTLGNSPVLAFVIGLLVFLYVPTPVDQTESSTEEKKSSAVVSNLSTGIKNTFADDFYKEGILGMKCTA